MSQPETPTAAALAETPAEPIAAPSISRAYQCRCGRPVFLRNSRCLACQTPLGYVVEQLGVLPLAPVDDTDFFTVFGDPQGRQLRRCANFESASGCNWMVPVAGAEGLLPDLCLACSTTRTIPDLSVPENAPLWNKMEQAKRRLLS
ncbi:MAG TPA: zinc-ribbon domain-containing protein, partial [Variovorax sp.]|nr:zinc-ribbon domain-containing protein [Variovorax sp.]